MTRDRAIATLRDHLNWEGDCATVAKWVDAFVALGMLKVCAPKLDAPRMDRTTTFAVPERWVREAEEKRLVKEQEDKLVEAMRALGYEVRKLERSINAS